VGNVLFVLRIITEPRIETQRVAVIAFCIIVFAGISVTEYLWAKGRQSAWLAAGTSDRSLSEKPLAVTVSSGQALEPVMPAIRRDTLPRKKEGSLNTTRPRAIHSPTSPVEHHPVKGSLTAKPGIREETDGVATQVTHQTQQAPQIAPYLGNLKERCEELAKAIDQFVQRRKSREEIVEKQPNAVTLWMEGNSNEFRQQLLPDAVKIQNELADIHERDPELDRTLDHAQRSWNSYLRDPSDPTIAVIDIIEMQKIAERLRVIAGWLK
jgi:hypothetical protein